MRKGRRRPTGRICCAAPSGRAGRSRTRRWGTCRRCRTRPSRRSRRCCGGRCAPRRAVPARRWRSWPRGRTGMSLPWSPPPAGLGFPELLGPPCRLRDLTFALLVALVVRRAASWPPPAGGPTTHLGRRPGGGRPVHRRGVRGAGLAARPPDAVEAALAARHLAPGGMALFDLSSWSCDRLVLPAGGLRLLPGPQTRLPTGQLRATTPSPAASRQRSGSSPATPPTRPRSPPRSTWCAPSSACPTWCWSATAG